MYCMYASNDCEEKHAQQTHKFSHTLKVNINGNEKKCLHSRQGNKRSKKKKIKRAETKQNKKSSYKHNNEVYIK